MGVKGLWKLVESAGVPVPVETLEQKILAVDVSIWLHQAVRGFRGATPGGQANAHLLTLFHRICKLLFYRIRPVFIFDGGVPYLKKQTLASRRLRREIAANRAKQVRERLLKNLLRSQAVRNALGRAGPTPSLARVPKPVKKEKDMFELPPLPQPLNVKPDPDAPPGTTQMSGKYEDEDSEDEVESHLKELSGINLHQFEFEGEAFQNLPIDTRHEILSDLQDTRKQNSWAMINDMPQELETFADFQMGRLRKRRRFQETLDTVRDEIRKKVTDEMEAEMFGDLEKHVSFSQRIISEDAAHSILVKKVKDDEGKTQKDNEVNDFLHDEGDTKGKFDDDVKDSKGKSPAKKCKRGLDKDFLTELAKQGVLRSGYKSDSESGWENDSGLDSDYSDNEVKKIRLQQKKTAMEEESFLKVVGSLLENSGLTQEEILALIKQEEKENCPQKLGNGHLAAQKSVVTEDKPSTSSQAPGFVFNPDADSSSDDDDLVEVPEDDGSLPPHSPSLPHSSSLPSSQPPSSFLQAGVLIETKSENSEPKTEVESNNIGQLLGTKSNSLYLKIVQQKVDDLVHINALKTTPMKAPLDSRKVNKHEEVQDGGRKSVVACLKERRETKQKTEDKSSESSSLKPVKISLDFDVKPLKMEDDIFADIFTDINCVPSRNTLTKQPLSLIRHPKNIRPSDKVEVNNKVEAHGAKNTKIASTNSSKAGNTQKTGRTEKSFHAIVPEVRNNADGYLASRRDRSSVNGETEEGNENGMENEVEFMGSSDDSDLEEVVDNENKREERNEKSIEKTPIANSKPPQENEPVNEKLKNNIYELVKLEVEKMLKQKDVEKSVKCDSKNTEGIRVPGEVHSEDEVMSSSDESESSEGDDNEKKVKENDNDENKAKIQTAKKGQESNEGMKSRTDSDDDADDDFVEVRAKEEEEILVDEKEGKSKKKADMTEAERKKIQFNNEKEKTTKKQDAGCEKDEKSIKEKVDLEREQKGSEEVMDESVGGKKTKKAEDQNEKEDIDQKEAKSKKEVVKKKIGSEKEAVHNEKATVTRDGQIHPNFSENQFKHGEENMNCVRQIPEKNKNSVNVKPIDIPLKLQSKNKSSNERTEEAKAAELNEQTSSDEVVPVERPLMYSEDELKHLERELVVEQESLVAEAKRSDRIATNLNEQTYGESQHLLQLFGIPYLVAPMEAEAQCAFLDAIKLSAGTITDDSDIFLFGGTKVYKNFFNHTKHVEFFKTDNITANLGLDREKMISLAMLTGSDYTEGVESVGAVAAMEVLAEFPGEGITCLRNLKKWWNAAHNNVTLTHISKAHQKLSQVMLPESFPNEKVFEAYLTPEVDESREKFSWAVPNVEALRTFTGDKFGWSRAKTDEILIPVMKRLGIKTSQMRIDSFFTNIKLVKEDKIASKRIQDAIANLKGEGSATSEIPTLRNKLAARLGKTQDNKNKKRKKKKNKEGVEEQDKMDGVEEEKVAEEGEGSETDPCGLPDATVTKGKTVSSRTLLVDPSETQQGKKRKVDNAGQGTKQGKRKKSCEGEAKPGKRGRKKNPNNDKANEESPKTETSGENPKSVRRKKTMDNQMTTGGDEGGRKLTKEIMFKALLEKEKINQREEEERRMKERKRVVAELLKQKRLEKKGK